MYKLNTEIYFNILNTFYIKKHNEKNELKKLAKEA
jgi:hypothetical protein